MHRQPWFELHDQQWFPALFRDLVTEALQATWKTNHTYRPVVPLLREAVERSRSRRIIDLCSGGGGPWPALYKQMADGRPLEVRLTDLYPNARVTPANGLSMHPEPVDARCVPGQLTGFRTMFSSFHHFDPPAARAILADAFSRREGIAVFEAARRSAWTLLAVNAVPLLALRAGLAAWPIPASRILWTYLLPVVPAVLWMDGVLSCLRSYSLADLHELTEGLSAPDYEWRMGEQRGGPVAITYLIGGAVNR